MDEDKAGIQIGRLILSLAMGGIIGYTLYSSWIFDDWFGIPDYAAILIGFIAFLIVYLLFTYAVK
ncbi:hypothetical protein HY992_00735 [Candidatus Micrarchaeota archaeon]|nr:hypothetical protein [Candidatus Micrarchaeota archaeon]